MSTLLSVMNDSTQIIAGRGPRAILDDYRAIVARRSRTALEHTILRTRSIALRHLLADLATDGRLTYDDVRQGVQATWIMPWATQLARVMAVQNIDNTNPSIPIAIFEQLVREHGDKIPLKYKRVLAELYQATGRFADLEHLLGQYPELAQVDFSYLSTDLINPFINSPYGDFDSWLKAFNRVFITHDVAPIVVESGADRPFDTLTAQVSDTVNIDGPLVTVILTAYRPTMTALRTSVLSLINQTWKNIEILVVDDASGPDYDSVFERIIELDPKVRVIRKRSNEGTYMARNTGLKEARGEYVTGQDSDDWSHPSRIERQMIALLDDPTTPGTISSCISTDEQMVMQRMRPYLLRTNTSSTLVRTRDALDAGGYLPARRGADTEFVDRLERLSGRRFSRLDAPLAIVRTGDETLSGSDFTPGWRHPSRWAFRYAYQYWHRTSATKHLRINFPSNSAESPVPVPKRFRVEPSSSAEFDVVFAGVWNQFGGPQRSMLDEISALLKDGRRVGIMHLEAARFMTSNSAPLCDPIQQLIADHKVHWILEDEPAQTRLLVLRYPPILQFPPSQPVAIAADKVLILANQAPSERDGSDIRYIPSECAANAEAIFGRRALWVPQGPTVRHALTGLLPAAEIADYNMPGLIQTNKWWCERESYRSDRPVIGRHSRDNAMKWPADRDEMTSVYPTDGSVEVRVMGGVRSALEVLGGPLPPAWVAFERDELEVRTFLNSLDFFVYYQHRSAFDAFGRAVLEALATGCVAVLPHHFQETFGDAAVYADESEAISTVWSIYEDPDRYRHQSRLAVQRVQEWFSYEEYARLVSELIREPRESLV